MNFLHTPYEPGVSLREDIFNLQFFVVVTGEMYYPEDDPIYGTYSLEQTLLVSEGPTISNVVARLLQIYESDNWPIRDEGVDYNDEDLHHDCGPVDFYPVLVEVFDRHNRLVMGGEFQMQRRDKLASSGY